LERALTDNPPCLNGRFPNGDVADAWLASYAELLSSQIDREPPAWSFEPSRTAREPWFAEDYTSPRLRLLALLHSPLPFKRRNIYALNVELVLHLRAGRPRKPENQKRKTNAARQSRFRARRREELERLRRLLQANSASPETAGNEPDFAA
jgi:hypothetical protein